MNWELAQVSESTESSTDGGRYSGAYPDLCKLPVHFFPSKMSIISTAQGLETIKGSCLIKETKKVFEIRLQKLHFGEFQEIQLFGIQNR